MLRCRFVALSLVSVFLCGIACTSYRTIEPAEVESFDDVRVRLTNGAEVQLRNPSIEADTLRGYPGNQGAEVSLPLNEVAGFEASQTDWLKTAGLTLGVTAGVLVVGAVAWSSSNCIGSACGE